MKFLVICIVLIGTIVAWIQLTNGTGFLGKRFSHDFLQVINSKSAIAVIEKLGLSIVLGCVIFEVLLLIAIYKFMLLLFRQ